eukprot:TRINITY_DN6819_c0_g1_i1.p1 TRINITY_DN6819_c0_g1~~TRINITY_DN6819_c0_g1_i1.p1  ORF type:complete len:318 (-),score=112.47 TRINITY_DN6819_c0_g1_i1:89-1042(-)
MMQKCSIGARLWLKQSARISVNNVRLSSTAKVVHSSDKDAKDATKDSTPPPNIEKLSRRDYRYIFPEFLPDPNPEFRNSVSEKLARKDMIARRDKLEVPEFYVGTLMAVTVSDTCSPHPNKLSRFVGICIDRGGTGLRAWFILRNVVEGQGVEFMYQMYSPTLVKIEVLRLEKRLDDELYYLRDAPQEYSTVPFDMEPEILPEEASVPVNKTIVCLNPRPWLRSWEQMTGYVHGLELTDAWTTPGKIRKQARAFTEGTLEWHQQTLQFDLMRDYRNTIPVEEQDKLWEEVGEKLEERDKQMRKVAAKRAFVRPVKKL